MESSKYKIYEKLGFGTLLAGIGGFLDVYTYVLHKGVFANAQTGNLVLFAVSLSTNKAEDAVKYLYPLGAFILGIVLSELLRKSFNKANSSSWALSILFLELGILGLISFLPESVPDILITSSISFISSLQIGSFNKLEDLPFNTTMMTGNLKSLVQTFMAYLANPKSQAASASLWYALVLLSFILGAGLGVVLIQFFAQKSLLVCCFLQVLLIIQVLMEPKKNRA